MRIAIVNDMMLAVEALRRVIISMPGHEVAWVALNGEQAVEKCCTDKPDMLLMDLIMPVMDGVRATREIMARCPCPVLVVTATVEGNASKVFEAMGHGALDAVCTPTLGAAGNIEGAEALMEKMHIVARLGGMEASGTETVPARKTSPHPPPQHVIALGASTGGPKALCDVLSTFPAMLNAPNALNVAVAVIQHVDRHFARGLAEWLDRQIPPPVVVAQENQTLRPGKVYVAATNDHMIIDENFRLHYTPHPRECPYRPSVDAFFTSLARCGLPPCAAALLTGMGRDGAAGLKTLRDAGWHTIAQDQASSVVYGMPRAASELDAACETLGIHSIGPALLKHVRS